MVNHASECVRQFVFLLAVLVENASHLQSLAYLKPSCKSIYSYAIERSVWMSAGGGALDLMRAAGAWVATGQPVQAA